MHRAPASRLKTAPAQPYNGMQKEQAHHISALLKAFVKENHLEEGLLQCRVFDAWNEVIAGMSTGTVTRGAASSLTSSKSFKNGVLTLRINSSVFRMQLRMNSDTILKKINDRLGGTVVLKLIFL